MAPRSKVSIGTSQVNASDLKGLRLAWQHRHLVLFLGAGVSFDYGIPGWKDLVLELLFQQIDEVRRMEQFVTPYRRALAAWLVDYFDYDPVVLARVIRNDIRRRSRRQGEGDGNGGGDGGAFLERVREQLYRGLRQPSAPTTLQAVADLVEATGAEQGLAGIVTFNFDDLLERDLAERAAAGRLHVSPVPISQARRAREGVFPIIHPHGFLPREGGGGSPSIVFAEEDYHELSATVFHWALTEIVAYLRHSHVLFLGLSMSDPNLRRLLDASYVRPDIPAHWQVQRRHTVDASRMGDAIDDIQRRARRWGDALGDGLVKMPDQVADAIRATLAQADSYDRALFESMGVKTVWVDSFADIPPLLQTIQA